MEQNGSELRLQPTHQTIRKERLKEHIAELNTEVYSSETITMRQSVKSRGCDFRRNAHEDRHAA